MFRYEKKYIVSMQTAEILKRRIASVIMPDPHSLEPYWIHNIYFDDIYETAYHAKRLGAFVRDKYRIRYYNNDHSFIRLERKHKQGELSTKYSVMLTPTQMYEMAKGNLPDDLSEAGQVGEEFARLYRTKGLRPVAAFNYLRDAYAHIAGNTRLTFDSRIAEGIPDVPGVFEVKYTGFLPLFIRELLTGLSLTQSAASKFGMVMDWNRKVRGHGKSTGINIKPADSHHAQCNGLGDYTDTGNRLPVRANHLSGLSHI
jgi:hypothetical protein